MAKSSHGYPYNGADEICSSCTCNQQDRSNIKKGSGEEIPMSLQFPWYDFVLLVAATVFITAGGYVINDYFDIKTDLINKGKVIVGTKSHDVRP